MRRVQEYLPGKVYTCMFSATFPHTVRSLARQFMEKPDFLSLSRDHVHVADTSHQTVIVSPMEKDRTLVRLIELENPESAIIFCNTRQRVHYIAVVLQRFGYNADELSGDLPQKDREKVMNRLRQGKLRFCVATDVAARGIDISDLSHVFQYELPEDPEIYIHRAGRTGRAGAAGVAITLVGDFTEQVQLKKIARQYNIEFEERPSPDEDALARVVSERMIVQLEAQMRDRDKLRIERLQRFVPMVRELANDEEGVQLIAMLLDDLYQQTLHTPPVTLEETEADSRQVDRGEDRSDKSGKKRRRSGGRSRRN
jgi:ATP-dependent RNA helicase DeaD